MEGGVCEVKFFQVFTMIVMVLATVGVIGESGRGKHVYIALFAAAGAASGSMGAEHDVFLRRI